MASEAVGGLYIAVGVDADPAIKQIRLVNEKVATIAAGLNGLNGANLDKLAAKMDKIALAADKASKKVAAVGAASNGIRDVAPAASARAAAPARVIPVSDVNGDLLKEQERLYAAIMRERELENRATMASIVSQAKERQRLTDLEIKESNRAATNAEKNRARETSAAKRAADAQARAAQKAADQQTSISQVLAAGSSDLFVGLGAARSGNLFYGLAAFLRYGKNVSSALQGMRTAGVAAGEGVAAAGEAASAAGTAVEGAGVAARGATAAIGGMGTAALGAAAGIAAIPVAVIAYGAALTAVGAKIAQFGLESATNIEMLKIQFEGLLGTADRGAAEVDRVLKLGTTSIVPTEQLLQADRSLLAYGVTADSTRGKLLEFISAFSSVTGANEIMLSNLTYGIGQIAATGKATALDLRQLANASIGTPGLYAEIAKQQKISYGEAAKLTEQGKLTADIVLPAILAKTKELGPASQKARDSTQGILNNISDIATINAGRAFEGLLGQLKPVLLWVQDFIKAFDFQYIANSFSNVVLYFKQAFGQIGAGAKDTSKGIAETIGKAVNVVGFIVVKVAQVVVAVFDSIITGVNAVWAGVQALVGGALRALSIILKGIALIPGPQQDMIKSIEGSIDSLATKAGEGAGIAARAWVNGAKASALAWGNFAFNSPAFRNPGQFGNQGASSQQAGYVPPEKPLEFNLPIPDTKAGGTDKVAEALKAFIDKIKSMVKEAQDASKSLGEAITLPFAKAIAAGGATVKTKAQEAFSSLDINNIVDQYSSIAENLKKIYAPLEDATITKNAAYSKKASAQRKAITAALRADTYALVEQASRYKKATDDLATAEKELSDAQAKLQKDRDAITQQYNAQKTKLSRQYDGYYTATSKTEGSFTKGSIKAAQDALDSAKKLYEDAKTKLDDLKSARDDFLNGLKDSIRGYVNSLSGVTNEIDKYTRLDEAGSFSLTKSSEADLTSFRASLQKRLDALKEFRAQVALLGQRGLDSNFLKDLTAGGVESSGAIVKSLAGASDAELADINRIQTELSSQITGLQANASAQWFDAGIAAQEAFTAPLKAAYDAAQKDLDGLTAAKDMALGILEAWYADQNALIDSQEKTAQEKFDATKKRLDETIADTKTKTDKVVLDINAQLAKIPKNALDSGIGAVQGLIDGLNDKAKRKELQEAAKAIADSLQSTIKKGLQINSPSKVMIGIGQSVTDGLVSGLESGLPDIANASMALTASVPSVDGVGSLTGDPQVPMVKVYIGNTELTDIVDVQIEQASAADRNLAIAGRRL